MVIREHVDAAPEEMLAISLLVSMCALIVPFALCAMVTICMSHLCSTASLFKPQPGT